MLGDKLRPKELKERGLRLDLSVHKTGLREELQYLWAHYNPIHIDSRGNLR